MLGRLRIRSAAPGGGSTHIRRGRATRGQLCVPQTGSHRAQTHPRFVPVLPSVEQPTFSRFMLPVLRTNARSADQGVLTSIQNLLPIVSNVFHGHLNRFLAECVSC